MPFGSNSVDARACSENDSSVPTNNSTGVSIAGRFAAWLLSNSAIIAATQAARDALSLASQQARASSGSGPWRRS